MRIYLHDAVADGAVLPFPQKHQADHNHSRDGHGDHQQAEQSGAAEAEVLPQGAVSVLTGRTSRGAHREEGEEAARAKTIQLMNYFGCGNKNFSLLMKNANGKTPLKHIYFYILYISIHFSIMIIRKRHFAMKY